MSGALQSGATAAPPGLVPLASSRHRLLRAVALRVALVLPVLLPAQALVGLDLDVPVLRPVVALLTFVAVPTVVLYRRSTLPADSGTARFVYAVGLAVLGLVVGGLAIDAVLPLVGVDRPLAPLPLAITWTILDLGLLCWRPTARLAPAGWAGTAVRAALAARWRAAPALALVAAVLAVCGAVRLNNRAGGGMALAAGVVGGIALLALLLDRRPSLNRDSWTLWLVAASLLLGTALRGWNITGHDIQGEYLAYRITDTAQAWHPSALANAYNACLSVTVLPTILTQITRLPATAVFKVMFQLLFALVPVLTYLLARRMVPRRAALGAAVLVMAFPTFFVDMPYLTRQETAYLFIGLLLLTATEPGRRKVVSRVMALVFGAGVLFSHYSTTYLLLIALVVSLAGLSVASAGQWLLGRNGRRGRAVDGPLVLLHPLVVVLLGAGSLLWAGPVTHTGSHASSVLHETIDTLTGRGRSGPSSSDTSYSLFSGHKVSHRERMNQFVGATLSYRDQMIPVQEQVLPHPGPLVLHPDLHDPVTSPDTGLGRALAHHGLDPVHLDNGARLLAALLMQLLAGLGLLWSLRRRLRAPPAGRIRPSRDVAFLAWGAMTTLALVVLVPNLSVEYGVLRAFEQTLLVIAPLMTMGLWWLLRLVGPVLSPRRRGLLVGVVPVLLLLVLTGVLPAAIGGQQQRIAAANSGDYYQRFYASDAETAGIYWLAQVDHADRTNVRLIASRNVDVRLLALSLNRAPVADRLFPTVLSKDAYVFVDSQILHEGESTVFYTGDSLTYTYPLALVDDHLDLLYSSPDAQVFR